MASCTSFFRTFGCSRNTFFAAVAFLASPGFIAHSDSAFAAVGIPVGPVGEGPLEVATLAVDQGVGSSTSDWEGRDSTENATAAVNSSVTRGITTSSAFADFGVLRASVASGPFASSTGFLQGRAKAYFEDNITVLAPSGSTLTEGLLRLDYRLTGNLDAGGGVSSANASVAFKLGAVAGSGSFGFDVHSFDASVSGSDSQTFDQIVSLEFPITFGDPHRIAASLFVDVARGGSADFSHTAELETVILTDTDHVLIPDFSMSSNSGTNYLSSVPEPSSMLYLSMLTMLHFSRRNRRRTLSN